MGLALIVGLSHEIMIIHFRGRMMIHIHIKNGLMLEKVFVNQHQEYILIIYVFGGFIFKGKQMIEKLSPNAFTWSRWRRFNLFTCRYSIIVEFKNMIKRFAIGYIEGEKLYCRPKFKTYAVMFLKDDEFSWCHLTKKEFEEVFK